MEQKNRFFNWYSQVVQKQKKGLYDFNQKIYITILSFISNDLITVASAGAYNFLMSALPIYILTITILLRVLNRSPEEIKNILQTIPAFTKAFDVNRFFYVLTNISQFSYLEIVVAIFVVWMARRFFASIQHAIRKVYRKQIKIEPIKVSLIVFVGEIIIINIFVFLFMFLGFGNAILKTDFVQNLFSKGIFSGSALSNHIYFILKTLFKIMPFIFMHLFIFAVYYFMPPVKPKKKNAYFSALVCTASHFILEFLFSIFRNTSKFTVVYGFVSNVILLLIQVWFFFFLFVFFAQFMYVTQFFKSFVVSQLYRMPNYSETGFLSQLERTIFIEPPKEYQKKAIQIKEGEFIFKYGDESTELYYIISGSVRIITPNKILDLEKGNSFGEFACLLNGKRVGTAIAKTDCLLAVVPEKEFLETLSIDGNVSRQALKILSDYMMNN